MPQATSDGKWSDDLLDLDLPEANTDLPASHVLPTAVVFRLNAEAERFLKDDVEYWRQRAEDLEYLNSPAGRAIERFEME
jgi:hypothetical protein